MRWSERTRRQRTKEVKRKDLQTSITEGMNNTEARNEMEDERKRTE
jgi:hypothetical protein